MPPFPLPDSSVPWLTTDQMREVDRLMIDVYGIDLPRMMENAGRALALVARDRFLGGDPRGARVAVLAGPGGNGGGALVAARRLHGWGARIEVATARPASDFAPVPGAQLAILQHLDASVTEGMPPAGDDPDLILDGVIGYSLEGDPRGAAAELIHWVDAHPAPVLALDAPSGIDTADGRVADPAIRAAATLTLALPKEGLRAPAAAPYVGELYLADIGVPPQLYRELGLEPGPLFARSDVLRLEFADATGGAP